jgi:Antirepressor regulating drug resistance, predicted signal transduction N-terminal membrane component
MSAANQTILFLLDATLVGSGLVLALLLFQFLGRRWLAPKWLKLAWVIVSLRFLLPVSANLPGAISVTPAGRPLMERLRGEAGGDRTSPGGDGAVFRKKKLSLFDVVFALWAAGAAVSAGLLVVQAARLRRILRQRQSTDHDLLELLESAKTRLGVHAPIGLILSEEAAVPMIVGWLRPRIILPASFVRRLSESDITRILVHELAHFESADVPVLWLAALVRVVHWYNPLTHVLVGQLRARQEEACDARAMEALRESGQVYGQGLLAALRMVRTEGGPSVGALAAVSSFRDMQGRVRLLVSGRRFSVVAALGVLVVLTALSLVTTTAHAALVPVRESARMALRGTEDWLDLMDRGDFVACWETASRRFFRKPTPNREWLSGISRVRHSLGALHERRLHNQTFLPVNPEGLRGPFVVTVFESAFERMPAALETVTFVLDKDGRWRASAYYVRPAR